MENLWDPVVPAGKHELKFSVKAADAIDRVEILKNNILDEMAVHSGTWETRKIGDEEVIRVKFAAEFGWGPNPRFYKDMLVREWDGSLTVPGRLVSIEKAWNSYGQKLYDVTENSCKFHMTTYMSTATGHWMGPSAVQKEGFIFEIEASIDEKIMLHVDGKDYQIPVKELLHTGRIIAEYEEAEQLAKETFGDIEHYRDDLIWHTAYKMRLRQGVIQEGYQIKIARKGFN